MLYHQHNPSFCLDKHIRKATDNGINLIGCDWLSIFADMQPLAVNRLRNLFRSHPSVQACEAVKYGFFDLHKFNSIYGNLASIISFGTPQFFAISGHLDAISQTLSIISAAFLMLFDVAHASKSFLVMSSNFPFIDI